MRAGIEVVDRGLRSLHLALYLCVGVDRGLAIDLCLVATHSRLAIGQLYHSLAVALLRLDGLVGKGTDLLGYHLHLLALHIVGLRAHIHLLRNE